MNKLLKNIIWLFLVLLLAGNIGVFVSGINLSDKTSNYERDFVRYHKENMELEKEIYKTESLANTASQAAALKFVEITAPYILENTTYAFNR